MAIQTSQQSSLPGLQLLLLRLAETVDRAIIDAQQVLVTRNRSEATRVLASALGIERLHAELEAEAHRLLAQQPTLLGEDLRVLTASLVLALELRWIGGYAHDIVVVLMRSSELHGLSVPAELNQIAHKAREMLQDAIRAVVTHDPAVVKRLRTTAGQVGELYQQVRQALLEMMRAHVAQIEPAADLLWVAHCLERMADHSVIIAERAAFIATGTSPARSTSGRISQACSPLPTLVPRQ